jgi:hypothetical protein
VRQAESIELSNDASLADLSWLSSLRDLDGLSLVQLPALTSSLLSEHDLQELDIERFIVHDQNAGCGSWDIECPLHGWVNCAALAARNVW